MISVALWVGYDHPVSLGKKEAGGRTAAPIARSFLEGLSMEHGVWPAMPEGVVRRVVDEATGLLAREGQGGLVSYFLKGTEPTELSPLSDEEEGEGLFLGGEDD